MRLVDKPLVAYFAEIRIGIALLIAVGAIRFVMLPVFDVPYDGGTTYTSMTILFMLLCLYYFYSASRRQGTSYRDILGIAFVLAISTNVIIAAAILIDDLGNIDTYFTDPAHGGSLNPFLHAGGHVLGSALGTLFWWGIGSIILKLFGKK